MAQQLSSPGVSVELSDESFYTSAAPGTVPLIFVATAANKLNSAKTGIAPGTTSTNNGKVYLLTGQKDLLDTFGTPVFKTDSNNSPVHAGEQNEYGLQAAYSYLGTSNRAFVVRADVDLEQLNPSAVEPTGVPENGTFWLDTATTHWGLFEWNSDAASTTLGQTFSNVVPTAITDISLVVDFAGGDYRPKPSYGATGTYAVVLVSSLATMWFKSPRNGQWAQLGSVDWVNSRPTVQCENSENSFMLIDAPTTTEDADAITINSEIFTGFTSLTALVELIADRDIDGISAEIVNNKLELFSTGVDLDLDGTLPQTATKLGVTIGLYNAPALAISAHTVIPQFKRKDIPTSVTGKPTGSVWIKTTAVNRGTDWVVQRYNTAAKSWISVKAPVYKNGAAALAALDPTGGGINLAGNTLYVKYNDAEFEVPAANFKIYRRIDVTATNITSALIKYDTFQSGAYSFDISESVPGTENLVTRTVDFTIPALPLTYVESERVADIIDRILFAINDSRTATSSVNAVQSGNRIVISHRRGGEIEFNDGGGEPLSKLFSPVTTANFYRHASFGNGDPLNENKYIATLWTEYSNDRIHSFITPSDTVLTGAAVDGLLWYDPKFEEVDIMYNDGTKWRAYRNVDHGGGVGATDVKGPLITPTKPTTQSDGISPLVEGDLWIDMSDVENYPVLYKYINFIKKWEKVDITDQTSENGIVFADARWNNNGVSSESSSIVELLGGRLEAELTAEQRLMADFVDFDAPTPELYPKGTMLWNLRRSGFNVKRLHKNYVNVLQRNVRFGNEPMTSYYPDRWVSEAANLSTGAGAFGRHAQRGVVVQALQSVTNKNQQIRDEESRKFNLIACPGYPELVGEMKILNYDRGITAFVIGDTPARLAPDATSLSNWGTNQAGAVEDGDNGLVSSDEYLAFFYPWGYTSDNLGNNIVVPPSHMMLRTIALSDGASHPWYAPAGTTRGVINNATGVVYVKSNGEIQEVSLNSGQRDALASIKVNPITFIAGSGLVNMGQYTRASAVSALDRINVARLVVQLRKQLSELTRPYLFQPNDLATRNQVQHAAEQLLMELMGQRALYDYVVRCDASNNTPARIDRSELYLDVAIEPTKAVEFIYVPLVLRNTGEIKTLGAQ